MSWALPVAFIAKASVIEPPGTFRAIVPRLSGPMEYVPVNGWPVSTAAEPTPLVSSSPFVKFPAPSARNLPTTAKGVEPFEPALKPLRLKA